MERINPTEQRGYPAELPRFILGRLLQHSIAKHAAALAALRACQLAPSSPATRPEKSHHAAAMEGCTVCGSGPAGRLRTTAGTGGGWSGADLNRRFGYGARAWSGPMHC